MPKRSTRSHRQPSHLQDYITPVIYPIQEYMSYNRLHPQYKAFICHINVVYEPQYFQQAIQFPEWKEAMAAEIKALEDNHTWSVVPLPSQKQAI